MQESEDTPGRLGELIRFGKITSVDLAARRCVVTAGDVVTGPIRWLQVRAGRTRTWSPPSLNEQCLLLCPDADIAAAVALLGLSSNEFPPAGDSLRELVEFEDGAVLAYDPEAHLLEAILPAGGALRVEAPAGVTIVGDVAIEGNVTIEGGVESTDDIIAGGISLMTHTHGGVQTGGSETGEPS